jgi:hypothetical protein
MDLHFQQLGKALQQRFRRDAKARQRCGIIFVMLAVVGGEDGHFHLSGSWVGDV